jgi:hypothetical protein
MIGALAVIRYAKIHGTKHRSSTALHNPTSDFRRAQNRPGSIKKIDGHRDQIVRGSLSLSEIREDVMRKAIVITALALSLVGCETARQDRALTGGLIGGAAGGVIGGVASNSWGGALAGGVIGAAAGAIIADATRPGYCYRVTASGRKRYFRC